MLLETFHILWTYKEGFLSGLKVTMELALTIRIVGMTLGTLLGFATHHYKVQVGIPVRLFSFVLSSMPILVVLFWLHYPLQAMFDVVIDPFYTSAFTFTMINIFGVSELVRSALSDFPQQYIVAAQVCGLTHRQIAQKIQFPILFRQVFPGLLMLQVTMLHTTLFASLISTEELFRVSQRINASIYKPVEIYTALGVFFLAICLPVNAFAWWIKEKYTKNLSEK